MKYPEKDSRRPESKVAALACRSVSNVPKAGIVQFCNSQRTHVHKPLRVHYTQDGGVKACGCQHGPTRLIPR